MGDGRQGAGQEGPQRMVVVDSMKNLPNFSGEKTEISRQASWCILMIIWKYNKLMLQMTM